MGLELERAEPEAEAGQLGVVDTPQRRLARAGIRLTREPLEGESVWRLTLPRERGRAEFEARGGADAPPELVRELLRASLRGAPLLAPVAEVVAAPPAAEDLTTLGLVRRMLARQYEQLLVHDPGFRVGDDPEDVHRLRVAVRRLRATLRVARPLLEPAWADVLREELRWLGVSLGPLRDLDVLVAHVEEVAPDEEVLEALRSERAPALAAGLEALRTPRYLALLDDLEAAAAAPRVSRGDIDAVDLARDEFKRLRRTARRTGADAPDEDLHRLRIRAKRARYAAELVEPAVGQPAADFVTTAKRFQDVVGAHQDAVVAEERLRPLLPRLRSQESAFALGRLVEHQRGRRALARAELAGAWAALERAGRRAWS